MTQITPDTAVRMPLLVLLGAVLAIVGFVAGYYRTRDAERAWTQSHVRGVIEDTLRAERARDEQYVLRSELSEKLSRIEQRLIRLEVTIRRSGDREQ
jgi:hypothetical protein